MYSNRCTTTYMHICNYANMGGSMVQDLRYCATMQFLAIDRG